MKNIACFSFAFFFLLGNLFAQHRVAEKIINTKSAGASFDEIKLFSVYNEEDQVKEKISTFLNDATYLSFDQEKARTLLERKAENIHLVIPLSSKSEIGLDISLAHFLTPDFSIISSSGIQVRNPVQEGLHYQGMVTGDALSVCAISIYKGEVMGFISSPTLGNIVIGKLKDNKRGTHIVYNDQNLLIPSSNDCKTENDNRGYTSAELQPARQMSVNCIRLYWEINFDVYTVQGGMTNTTNYALAIFNQSSVLYNNDGIPVQLSQLYIWDTASPYTGTSTSTLLNQFQSNRTSFAGDLGHLLGDVGSGGVAASTSGICASNIRYSQCYSDVSPFYQTVPLYSWTIEVITHEQGHLMGSRHTHACVWNGNNTAIDGCGPTAGYPYEGSCSGAPIPSGGGTIMSYCHLISAGINFSNGFGTQPATVILNKYNSAACLTACTGGSFCGACSGLISSNITTSSVDLSWSPALNAGSYTIQYRISGTGTWTVDTTSNTNYSISGLLPGETYEWQVQSTCSGGTSVFSSSAYFITVPLVCAVPSGHQTSSVSSISAFISWSPVNAAIRYLVRYKAVSSGTWMLDSTSNTYMTLRFLNANTDYEWQVQTVCAGEGTSGYSNSFYFTTLEAGTPVTVTIQPDAACGKDALVSSDAGHGSDYQNFGTNPEFNALAWTNSGNLVIFRSLLQFDLSFIPAGSGVQNATLSLYWNPNSSNIGHSTMSGPNNALFRKISQPWDEMTVTWVNQPGTDTTHAAVVPASTSTTQNYTNIDVTDIMQDFVNDPLSNYGMMIQLLTETQYRSLIFSSSDHPDAALHPKLEITYAPNIESCVNYQYSNCYGTDALLGNSQLAGYDTSNFGNNVELDAVSWTYGGQKSELRSLIYWNLSDIPTNAIINQADLTLFWNPTSSNTGHSSQSGPNDAALIRVSSPWSEDAVTWNTQPSIDTSFKAILPVSSSPQQDYTVDVSNLVQKMVNDPASNYGMLFKLNNENYYRSMIFCSSDHADPARHPKIEICYSLPTAVFSVGENEKLLIYNDALSGIIRIQSTKGFPAGTEVTLYNTLGRTEGDFKNIRGDEFSISTKSLSSGIYFIQVRSSGNVRTEKILITH